MIKLRVGGTVPVNVGGRLVDAQIRRIGESNPAHKGWVMLTLNVGADVGYCVARETEIAEDAA